MEPLSFGELTIDIDERDDALVCEWLGRSGDRDPGRVLGPWFEKAVSVADGAQHRLVMRFHKLEHFNSSTITALIGLVQKARRADVPLVLVYDAEARWQKLSFDALRALGKDDGLLEIRSDDRV
ncbi:MAG: hypothetical protein AAGA56_19645 [Myxococcota bacterium]